MWKLNSDESKFSSIWSFEGNCHRMFLLRLPNQNALPVDYLGPQIHAFTLAPKTRPISEGSNSRRDYEKCSQSPPFVRLDLPSYVHPFFFWLICRLQVEVSRCPGFSILCILVRSINNIVLGIYSSVK